MPKLDQEDWKKSTLTDSVYDNNYQVDTIKAGGGNREECHSSDNFSAKTDERLQWSRSSVFTEMLMKWSNPF